MDDRMAIDILDTGHDALPELLFGCHPDVTQDRAGKLGEEALDEIEPGAVDGREGEHEAAARSSGEPASGLLRYMSGMIVENQLNRSAGRIGRIKESEEFDELAAAAPFNGCSAAGLSNVGSLRGNRRLWRSTAWSVIWVNDTFWGNDTWREVGCRIRDVSSSRSGSAFPFP